MGANKPALYHGEHLSPAQTFVLVLEYFENNGVVVQACSHIWASPAWPDPKAQPAYLNAVVAVQTKMPPLELLVFLKDVEQKFGRAGAPHSVRNAPRPLDLDILDYHGLEREGERLTLPHPRMLERAFVLFPLAEVAPHWRDPIKKRALHEWSARLALGTVAPMQRLGGLF